MRTSIEILYVLKYVLKHFPPKVCSQKWRLEQSRIKAPSCCADVSSAEAVETLLIIITTEKR
jgi:hypothetical protein